MHFLWAMLAWAHAQVPNLAEVLQAQSPHIAENSKFGAPELDSASLEKIQGGQTFWTERTLPQGERFLLISGLIKAVPAAVWIAILDDAHNGLSERITEHQLEGSVPGKKRLYQHLALPYPLSDRHWVLNILTDMALYKTTQGAAWRRAWVLDPLGEAVFESLNPPDKGLIQDGIWTPKNQGEWLILPVGEASLVIYRGLFDIGGRVPESISKAVGSQSALDLFNQLQTLSDQIPAHYNAQHQPILAPTGQNIPNWKTP
jgi:hypothetical protein